MAYPTDETERPYTIEEQQEKRRAYEKEKLYTATQEQPWNNCSIEQKTERMRQVVKGLQSEIEILRRNFDRLQSRFNEHQHVKGTIMIPHREYYGMEVGNMDVPKSRSEWF